MENSSTFKKIKFFFTFVLLLFNIIACSNRIYYYPNNSININNPSLNGYYYRIIEQEELPSNWQNQIEPVYFFNDSLFVIESACESKEIHDSSIVIYPKMSIYMYQRFGYFKKLNDTVLCRNQVNQQMKRPIKSTSIMLIKGDTLIDLISNNVFCI